MFARCRKESAAGNHGVPAAEGDIANGSARIPPLRRHAFHHHADYFTLRPEAFTFLTPWTPLAAFSAFIFSDREATLPFSLTSPRRVVTDMSLPSMPWDASAVLTCFVIPASRLASAWLAADGRAGAVLFGVGWLDGVVVDGIDELLPDVACAQAGAPPSANAAETPMAPAARIHVLLMRNP